MYSLASSFSSISPSLLLSWSLWTSLLFVAPTVSAPGGQQFTLQPYHQTNYWVPTLDEISYFVMELEIKPGTSRSAQYIQSILHNNHVNGVYGVYGDAQLNSTQRGLVFTTQMTVGSQTFTAVVDTGSSDTWLVGKGFQCLEAGTGDHVAESTCNFGPAYSPANTFKPIANENFYIQYSDGESLTGTWGTETVRVGGVAVFNQQIAVVNTAAFNGDGLSSGLLGLAFAADTRAYSGNNPNADSQPNQKIYNPFFTNMYSEGIVPPLFSVALDRSGGGQLAFGGLPPVNFAQQFASSPFEVLTAATPDGAIQNTTAYSLYTITTEGYSYRNASSGNSTQVQMIVDTGTTVTYVPQAIADAVNYQFLPPPFYRDANGYYIIPCTAKPPKFGVKIGAETFQINPLDMIINEGGQCISGIGATAPGGTSVLGHSFLKNVVAVFDIGASMMRFSART